MEREGWRTFKLSGTVIFMVRVSGGFMGLGATLFLIASPVLSGMVVLFTAVMYGMLGFLLAVAILFSIVYYFNKARKHWRAEAFDDRLSDVRMREAREELIMQEVKRRRK